MNGGFDNYLPAELPDDGGDLAPYAPAGTDWLPASAPAGTDYVPDLSHSAAPVLFGQRQPHGLTPQHANQVINEAAGIFTNDMRQLGVLGHVANAAIQWYRRMATAPVPHEPARHGYDLSGLTITPQDRPYAIAFLNHMRQRGADQASVRYMLWWYGELTRRLQAQQQRAPAPTRAARPLSDAELDAIDARSESDREAALDVLRVAWGDQLPAKMRVVRAYYRNLPAPLREHIENAVLPNGVLAENDPETIARLYNEATGGSLPTGGSDLQGEIASLESRMRSDRRAWFRDEVSQHRLRRLYELRDGR